MLDEFFNFPKSYEFRFCDGEADAVGKFFVNSPLNQLIVDFFPEVVFFFCQPCCFHGCVCDGGFL